MRNNQPVSLAMIDIDHFKKVNDTYGHMIGDRIIQRLSRELQSELREIDIIGRYGGEEFVVILPSTDAETAAQIIDRLREHFSQIPQTAGEKVFSVSFSAGVASFPEFESIDIIQAADSALYAAKEKGRNCVMLASEHNHKKQQ